jgi:hypothetical protein
VVAVVRKLDGDRRRVVAAALQLLRGAEVDGRARVLEEDPAVVDAGDPEEIALDSER